MISHPDKPILKPQDLEGKIVAHAVGETGTSYLGTFCAVNNIDCTKIKKVQMDAQSRVAQFLQNQVDAVSIYRTSDLPVLEQRTGIKFPILDLAQYGLVVPGLAAVTSDAAIASKSDGPQALSRCCWRGHRRHTKRSEGRCECHRQSVASRPAGGCHRSTSQGND